ncbi:MAG: type II secretion system secretin GspD [Pseudomonadota bacterium]
MGRLRIARLAVLLPGLLAALLAGCAGMQTSGSGDKRDDSVSESVREALEPRPARESAPGTDAIAPLPEEGGADRPAARLYPGSGELFDRDRAAQPVEVLEETGEYVLNFEGASLREVANLILGEMLDRNVLIDPAVEGRVTLQTTRPLPESALLSVLEELLRINGATLIESEGMVRVTPRRGALSGQVPPRTGPPGAGLNVRIVPLEYIGAAEMVTILEPFLAEESLVRVDTTRNLLMLAGTRRELAQWQETIDIFDVDWLEGMSVGLYTLANAEAAELAAELEQLFNAEGESPLAGLFRIIPVERLNAVMVVTPQPKYLEDAELWVERLDRTRDLQAGRLHVYRMQHRRASDVADVLGQVFDADTATTGERRTRDTEGERLAPDAEPALIGTQGERSSASERERPADRSSSSGTATATAGINPDNASDAGNGGLLSGNTRIIADDGNNSLLIFANTPDYQTLERALRELDIPARQVLVDASIIEVTLRDELRYGVQWFMQNSLGDYDGEGIFGSSDSLSRTFPGFNYSLVDSAGQVRAMLSALAEDSLVNVLSSPSVMVLDNHSANIRVGDQVPVRVSETTSAVTDNPVTVSNIQFRDTGVNLQVTPRVNAGGKVTLDVLQEVNDVSTTTTSGIDSPTIQQRLIESSVAVQSGETIVLGGLIREQSSDDQSGVPGLRRLPLVGPLFSDTVQTTRRTELLVLLTPRVAEDDADAAAITREFKQRMRGLGGLRDDMERHPVAAPEAPGNDAD